MLTTAERYVILGVSKLKGAVNMMMMSVKGLNEQVTNLEATAKNLIMKGKLTPQEAQMLKRIGEQVTFLRTCSLKASQATWRR